VAHAELSITVEGASLFVKLRGELDMATAPLLQACLNTLRSDAVLECTGLDFIDSSGIRTLVVAHAQFESRGDRLVLRDVPPHCRRVLEVGGVLGILNVE
jgi:anti-anti-sigma factor